MKGFTKEDSTRIGFASSCLFHEALNLQELRQWVLDVIEETEGTPPVYLIDLLDFNEPPARIYEVIGFVPHWPFSEDAKDALYGIAFMRGKQLHDCPLNRNQAIRSLAQHPEVESMFRSEFPSVKLTYL